MVFNFESIDRSSIQLRVHAFPREKDPSSINLSFTNLVGQGQSPGGVPDLHVLAISTAGAHYRLHNVAFLLRMITAMDTAVQGLDVRVYRGSNRAGILQKDGVNDLHIAGRRKQVLSDRMPHPLGRNNTESDFTASA